MFARNLIDRSSCWTTAVIIPVLFLTDVFVKLYILDNFYCSKHLFRINLSTQMNASVLTSIVDSTNNLIQTCTTMASSLLLSVVPIHTTHPYSQLSSG